MKRWQKYTLIGAGVVAVLLIVAVISFWSMIQVLMGTEGITGPTEAVPAAVKGNIPPPVPGANDWPSWLGPNGDGASTVKGITTDWSTGLKQEWEVNFLCAGGSEATWSAPVVKGNRLVVPGRGEGKDLLFCLNPRDGSLIWKAEYAAEADSSHGTGPRATPCIDGDHVYTFGRSGDVSCFQLLDGTGVWRTSVAKEGGEAPKWGHSSSPIVAGDSVVVQGGGSARVIAFDKKTGKLNWTSGSGPAGYAPVVPAKTKEQNVLLAFHGKGLDCIDPASGKLLWNQVWETNYDVNATTPVVAGNQVFITSDYGRGCALFAFDAVKATKVWENTAMAAHHSDPWIIDGHIYGYSGMSMQNRGDFKCLNLESGEEKWSTREIGHGTCLSVDGHLLCCDIKGNLFLVKPDPGEFVKVTEKRTALGKVRGPVWTRPVVANGKLYLRFKQKLVCYQLVP